MNHFAFYGLPVGLYVDEATVRRIYLQNSRMYHPDFHSLADEAAQAEMLEISTRNNEAYKTLSDPMRRLQYVLELKGLIGNEAEGQAPLPQDFLMEMMDINETIMELEFDFDKARYQDVLNAVSNLEKTLEDEIRPVLLSWTEAGGNEADLRVARDYFFKRRYLLRIKENLSKFAPDFEQCS